MTIEKAREARRNFHVGESKEHGTCSIASAEARPLAWIIFISVDGIADEVSWNHISAEERTQFSKAIETEWQGVLDFKAVTIIDPTQSKCDQRKTTRPSDLLSTCSALKGDRHMVAKAKARWCVHGFKDPDIHEIERSCPTPEIVVHQRYTPDPGVNHFGGYLWPIQGEGIHA